MKRKVHKDDDGLWVSAGGWCLRPRGHHSRFREGDEVIIESVDPVRPNFGRVRSTSSVAAERWAIFGSECVINGKPSRERGMA